MKENLINKIFPDANWTTGIVVVLRFVVGAVFIFSGFVKGIDSWGTIYKLTEYIQALGWSWLQPFPLFLSVAVAIFEFVFGVFILVGAYRRVAPALLLLLMFIMTPLTLWLMVTNSVPDCGCFGDAVILTNAQTFWKNVALTIALAFLLIYNRKVKNMYGVNVQWMVAAASFVAISLLLIVGFYYQPLIDFRPYKVGCTVNPVGNGGEVDEENYLFTYQKNGITQDFKIDSLPDDSWEFVERKEIETKVNGALPTSTDVVLRDTEGEVTDSVIPAEGGVLMLLFPDLDDVDISYTYHINELYDMAQSEGINVVGVTSASKEDIDNWNDLSMASYAMYTMDDSSLKMIARGNPAVVFIKDRKIMWKLALKAIPVETFETESADVENLADGFDSQTWLKQLIWGYLAVMALIFILNRTHILVYFSVRGLRKNQNKNVNLHTENNSEEDKN